MKRVLLYGCLAILICFYARGYSREHKLLNSMLLPNSMLSPDSMLSPIQNVQLPERFDCWESGKVPTIKDQGDLGTCWAFASYMALESSLLPGEKLDFSEDHMTLNNSFGLNQNAGGEYTISMAYLLAWQGPVLEQDDPYGDGYSPEGLKPVKLVQEIQILQPKDYKSIKESIMKYGGVQSSLYTSLENYSSESAFYNAKTYSYCYQGDQQPNHDIVIIGWDDHYPKENFGPEVTQDGAFLCITSWGEAFGQKGSFYVSYADVNIGTQSIVYTSVEDTDYYDHIYQNDLCGWEGQIGYGDSVAYCANVYRSQRDEELSAVGFYATKPNSSYEIYISTNVVGETDFNDSKLVATGSFINSGYYTVNLDIPIELKKQGKFAVILKITSPGAVHPVAIEYAENSEYRIDVNDGKSYISIDGITWESTKDLYQCDVCLKAYTRIH